MGCRPGVRYFRDQKTWFERRDLEGGSINSILDTRSTKKLMLDRFVVTKKDERQLKLLKRELPVSFFSGRQLSRRLSTSQQSDTELWILGSASHQKCGNSV